MFIPGTILHRSTRATRQSASQGLVHPATTSQDEHDAITFQQSVNLNNSALHARIIHFDGLPSPRPVTAFAVVPTAGMRGVNADDNYSMYRERFSARSRLEFSRLAGLRR
jgi:hypothetical protein